MKQVSYRERDFAFGQIILTMRSQIGLTQTELADYLGISRRAVGDWEAGNKYPRPEKLKQLIELALERRIFAAGSEANQIRSLWQASHTRVLLDENWLADLLTPRSPNNPLSRQSGPALSELNTIITPSNEREGWDYTTTAPDQDWSDALSVHNFFGREKELETLRAWLTDKSCRVITLLGLGGIGKTTLSVHLGQQMAGSFEYVAWRSLASSPSLEEFLPSILQFLSGPVPISLPRNQAGSISLLIRLLQQHRCLLILDNLETLLEGATESGRYREGYAGYGELLRRLAESNHQSCVLLTSREKPRELVPFEGSKSPVRTLRVSGLGQAEFQQILADRELNGDLADWADLTAHYSGNPLALKLIGETIREIFQGDIRTFLTNNTFIFGDVSYLLDNQFNRLPGLEQAMLVWLAIEREPVGVAILEKDMGYQGSDRRGLLDALQSLRRRSLIEHKDGGSEFTLQPVIMEYVTGHFIENVRQEIASAGETVEPGSTFRYLRAFPLMKALNKAYICQTQQRLIVRPLLDKLQKVPGGTATIENHLRSVIYYLQTLPGLKQGYAGGNLLNLLVTAGIDLEGWDFSNLNLWEANLAGVELRNVNLAGCDLSRTVFTQGFSYILALAYHPNGNYLAGGEMDGHLKVWQTREPLESAGYSLSLECLAHREAISCLAYSPDGRWLASGSYDRTVKLWQADTLENTLVGLGHSEAVRSVAFSPDGQLLASGSLDGTIKLWRVPTGELVGTLDSRSGWVWTLAFSPDSRMLASGSFESTISLWQLKPGEPVPAAPLTAFSAHPGGVFCLTFSPDGRALYSGGADQFIQVWSVDTGHQIQRLAGHSGAVQAIVLSLDGLTLVSGSSDRTLKVWQPAVQDTALLNLIGHNGPVVSVTFNPATNVVASSSSDRSIRLWSAERGQNLAVLQGYIGAIEAVAISPEGQYLAATGTNNRVLLWQLSDPPDLAEQVPIRVLRGHINQLQTVVFSPVGGSLASAGWDGLIKLWDLKEVGDLNRAAGGQTLSVPGTTAIIITLAFSPDGKTLAAGLDNGSIQLWSVATGRLITQLEASEFVWTLAFSPDRKMLASGGNDGQLRLWDTQNFEGKLLSGDSTLPIADLAYHPGARFLACARFDGPIEVWPLDTENPVPFLLAGHAGAVEAVVFQPGKDTATLLSGGRDGTVRLWDVAGQKELAQFAHGGFVNSVAFRAGGKAFFSAGDGGLIKLWDIESGRLLATYHDFLPYEGVNLNGVSGLTPITHNVLLGLGAVQDA